MTVPYNPLEKQHLAESVVQALMETPCGPLPPEKFPGAGVYAIYYRGGFEPYTPLARANEDDCWIPIYAGSAQVSGGRKGKPSEREESPLSRRLAEHARSIDAASNLELTDFRCQYLVVDEIWVPLAERLLIERYRPLWISVIDGFGNHDPGSGRHQQARSQWDVLHPGRRWADRLQPGTNSVSDLERMIKEYFDEAKIE